MLAQLFTESVDKDGGRGVTCEYRDEVPEWLLASGVCQVDQQSSPCPDIAALAVEFPTDWAPPGVFCRSVSHLQSHSHWEVVHRPHSTPDGSPDSLTQVFRNCITFTRRRRPGSVTFIDNFTFFVVCVNVDTSKMKRDKLMKLCQAIRLDVFAAVDAGLKTTHHSDFSQVVPSFLCPCQNQSCGTELHTAHISDDHTIWICSKIPDVFDCLSPEQTLWLNGQGGPHTPTHTV